MAYALNIKIPAGLEPVFSSGPARLRELLDCSHIETVTMGTRSRLMAACAFIPARAGNNGQVLDGSLCRCPGWHRGSE